MDYGPDLARIAAYEHGRAELVYLTGWTLEYIDNLGTIDGEALLQIYDAKRKLTKGK